MGSSDAQGEMLQVMKKNVDMCVYNVWFYSSQIDVNSVD